MLFKNFQLSKATTRHHGGVSLCRSNSKASHPQPFHCHFSVLSLFSAVSDQTWFYLIRAPCCRLWRDWLSLLKCSCFSFSTAFKYISTKWMVQLPVKVGMEIRAGTGLDPAAMSEEVFLQMPLHCAWRKATVGIGPRALPNKMKMFTIDFFISSLCWTIYKKSAWCKEVHHSPPHFCLLLTRIIAKHFIAVIDMDHTTM